MAPLAVPVDVISREVSVLVAPLAIPVDVISREVSVEVALPDLVALPPVVPPGLVAGSYLSVSYGVSSAPGKAYSPWSDSIFLSSDLVAGNGDDIYLATISHDDDLLPGMSYFVQTAVWIPVAVSGGYHIYVEADSADAVEESGLSTNNIAFSATPVSIQPFTGVVLSGGENIGPNDSTYDGQDLVVEASTVTIDGAHSFASLIIHQGGAIAHSQGSEAGMDLTVLGDLTIKSGSAIDVSGKGYSAGTGPGLGKPGSYYGGGYGGYGASINAGEAGHAPGYGDLRAPRLLGSGGNDAASFGGGALALNVGGTLILEGAIRSDGLPQVPCAGGGSGGSLWITATDLVGGGSITAQGGMGNTGSQAWSGGGGGGRVHLVTGDATGFTGAVQSFGGFGSPHGGAGTVVIEDATLGTSELVVRNFQSGLSIASNPLAWAPTALPSSVAFDSVVLDGGVRLWIERPTFGLRLAVTGDLFFGAGAAILGSDLGFRDGEGPGAGGTQAGGGYGGFGGGGAGKGAMYGEPVLPILAGSGGGGWAGPSLGGGAVVLDVGGDLQFDGLITVNGSNQDPFFLVGPTGGSGGTALLVADTISGVGAIEARGGNGDGQICGNLHAAGAGGRVSLHARDALGLAGFQGTVDVAGGYHPISGCGGSYAQDGTYYTAESSTAIVPSLDLIVGGEDFDALPSHTADPINNTAPDQIPGGSSGSWGNAGAWGYPPTYDSFASGDNSGVGMRVVDTSSFDTSGKTGHSLALRSTPAGIGLPFPNLFVCGQWEDEAHRHAGTAVSIEASVWVASGVGGGGIFSAANGNGEMPTSSLAPIADLGPAVEWLADGRLVAHQAGMAATTDVVLSTPFDAWQRVRMDVDLGADTYDLWWAPAGQPLLLVGQDLPFVTPQKRLDRFVIGQQQVAEAYYDDLVVELDPPTPPTLAADVASVSLLAGGTQNLYLEAGSASAGRLFLMLGSASGSSPGFPLAGGLTLPLNLPDPYFDLTLLAPLTPPAVGFLGALDGNGAGQAAFTLSPGTLPSLAGTTVHHAYVLFDPVLDFVSNAVPVTLVP